MKVCTFGQFAALPSGTIFSYWTPQVADGLYWKGETLYQDDEKTDPFDYYEMELFPTPKAHWEKRYLGEEGDPVFALTECRWALYEFDRLYAVYEKDDVERLIGVLQESLSTE